MLWLLRHAEAADGMPDDDRPLTDRGIRQAEAAGQALLRLGARLDTCLTSPKLRALQTAQLACEPLGVTPVLEPALSGEPFDVHELIAGQGQDVMIVGHDPSFTLTVHDLTGAQSRLQQGRARRDREGRARGAHATRRAGCDRGRRREGRMTRQSTQSARAAAAVADRRRERGPRAPRPERSRAVRQPRALVARLQRPRPPAGRGRVAAAARTAQVPGDLRHQSRRVLHGPRRRRPRPARRADRRPRARRRLPRRDARRNLRARARAGPPPRPVLRRDRSPSARRARHPDRDLRGVGRLGRGDRAKASASRSSPS